MFTLLPCIITQNQNKLLFLRTAENPFIITTQMTAQLITAIISPDNSAITLSTTFASSIPSRYMDGGMASTVPANPVIA